MNALIPQTGSDKPVLLGDILVKNNLITAEQLQEVLTFQAGLEKYRPLGLILVEKKLITVKQLNHYIDINHKRPKIGEILVRTKAITREQLLMAMTYKKTTRQRLAQILVQLGYTTETAVHQALAMQMNVPFVDLDRTTLGPEVGGFISKTYAVKNSAVPINVSPIDLTVAVEDPTNYVLREELQTLTKLKVIVVTSTKDQIARAIQRVYVTNKLTGELLIEEGFQFAEPGKAY